MKIGERFGQWVTVGNPFREKGATKILAKCDCGAKKVVQAHHLRAGQSKSCGCAPRKSHGESGSELYLKWANMIQRCTNPHRDEVGNYGNRGIAVCDAWKSFEPFQTWAKEAGYQEGLSLDRIDTNGNYFPENCRFTSYVVQSQNRRKQSNNTSGFIGVSMMSTGRFRAQAKHNRRTIILGTFDDPIKAALVRDAYVRRHYEAPTLNFSTEGEPHEKISDDPCAVGNPLCGFG